MSKGKVYLIGAGPGDPALLTCKAKRLLSECDVVCYDKLVSAAILASVPDHVELHQVGYRGYQHCHIDYGMHPDVMEYALAGKTVARLKAGDPCIFGRTTEECRELIQHDIAYEIVPGITAALGAAAYSGFPLTSGGIASAVTFVSGHQHLKAMESLKELDESGGTVVLYMGAKKLKQHAERLIENGRNPATPVALISNATSADHCCITGTLQNIGDRVDMSPQAGPALVVIGEVVSQADELNWRRHLPLAGKRFLVCGQYKDRAWLEQSGAEVIRVDSLATRSFMDREELEFLQIQKELAFDSLPAFELWWRALIDYNWDLRRFSMPLSSDDKHVISAMAQKGIIAQPVSKHAMVLTLKHEKVFDDRVNHYQIGRRDSKPLGYELPEIDWVLIDDTEIADSVSQYHQRSLAGAGYVPLSVAAENWLEKNGLQADELEQSRISQKTEPGLTEFECADVA